MRVEQKTDIEIFLLPPPTPAKVINLTSYIRLYGLKVSAVHFILKARIIIFLDKKAVYHCHQ